MATGSTTGKQTFTETTDAKGGAVGTDVITKQQFASKLQLVLQNVSQAQRVGADIQQLAEPLAGIARDARWCYDHLDQLWTYSGGMGDAGPPGS